MKRKVLIGVGIIVGLLVIAVLLHLSKSYVIPMIMNLHKGMGN